jgi:hypothetical protein
VPRLWASRKIAVLTDAVRDLGADAAGPGVSRRSWARELIEEIVRCQGSSSPNTAFLAREGTDLSRSAAIMAEAQRNFDQRAMQARFDQAP